MKTSINRGHRSGTLGTRHLRWDGSGSSGSIPAAGILDYPAWSDKPSTGGDFKAFCRQTPRQYLTLCKDEVTG